MDLEVEVNNFEPMLVKNPCPPISICVPCTESVSYTHLDVYKRQPRGLPMTYLVAPDGTVAKQFLGPVTAHEIEAAIAAPGTV